ncbi:MAG: hypothetical protein Q9191_001441, partial [Dirinaria sp. TL-2023a]
MFIFNPLLILGGTLVSALPEIFRRQTFNPAAQRIDVSGAHAFIAPGASDLRGPCPALNALANHGYIARNEYTTLQESLDASVKIYGAGMYIHHLFDLAVNGEAYLTQLPFFPGLYDLPGAGAVNPNYDLDLLGDYAVTRWVLGSKYFKSFYAITGDDASGLTYTPGYERIPENWYTRPQSDPYSVPFFDVDFKTLIQEHPELLTFGGNTGTVNSFTGLDVGNLTGGLYNAATLLQGNNLACFLFQSVAVAAPDLIRDTGVLSDVEAAVAQVNKAVAQA